MASFDDFQTAICTSGGGWWNPGRSPFPFSPSAAPLTNFMWSDSSLNYIHDDQAGMKLQAAAAAAIYSRSDDSSNDHNSSSAMSSDYAQIFQHDQKLPQGADHFSASDWSQNTNLINQGYNPGQFETTTLQTLAGPGTDMNYDVFDSSFSATANWPKMLLSPSPKQQLNGGTKQKHSNTNSSPNPFWDCWMGSDEIGPPALFEDQKPYNCGSKEMAQKVATKRKTTTSDEMYKRPRIETPSSLPTFKVRKEKLGDRITALQQLVSPFGKTDTASVLHEAIEYIKFLHDQVLRTPYMQNGTSKNQHQQKQAGESKSTASKQDLISRGLCLVPISSTFPLANEATSGFWTPTIGGTMTFR